LDRKYRNPAVWLLALCLAISVVTLVFYLMESDVSDEILFRQLSILRYSSFFVCVFSVYLFVTGIFNTIRRPSALSIMGVFMFLFFALYGACIIVIDAFIISITGGNG
jgi:hypothetical protein